MKILYVGPNVNHHQIPFAEELAKHVGEGNFLYAAKVTHEPERLNMGFPVFTQPWIINIEKETALFETWFREADVVLCDLREYHALMLERIRAEKLTFYFCERWFKPKLGKWRILHPQMWRWIWEFKKLSASPKFYYMAQSIFSADDFKFLGLCKDKIFNFGYFTPSDVHPFTMRRMPENKINLLWCGRMLHWKRPDVLVEAYAQALAVHPNLHLTIVGHGEYWPKVEALIKKHLRPEDYTHAKSFSATEMRELMNEADIYIMSSSGYEGWGAVVNESMTESCAFIGGDKVGAVSAMVEDGVNGLKFKDGDATDLASKIIYLADNKYVMESMKVAAHKTIAQSWNAQVAAERFLHIVSQVNEGRSYKVFTENVMKIV